MTESNGLYVNWPAHHLMCVALRDGGDAPEHLAPSVAAFHGISVDELKAQCRRTGEEWIPTTAAWVKSISACTPGRRPRPSLPITLFMVNRPPT